MRFLVDAQLPKRLAEYLIEHGHDAIHTIDLPKKNKTTDSLLRKISVDQKRVVITKDYDFLDSYLIKKEPYKILLVTTGNIRNTELMHVFDRNLRDLIRELKENHVVELSRSSLIVHF